MDAARPGSFRRRSALARRPSARAPAFLWVAGHPALDFANTLAAGADGPLELLRSDAELWRWARLGLPDERLAPARTPSSGLDPRVRALRSALHALFLARIERRAPPSAALARLNACLALAGSDGRLAWRAGRPVLERAPLRSMRALLRCFAASGAELLAAADGARLRRCAGAGCVLVFLDVSKAGRRRWCSMSACGNRAKTRAHRQRRRARS
jgi:predicted RNA-binding Zn ribbon-like protein